MGSKLKSFPWIPRQIPREPAQDGRGNGLFGSGGDLTHDKTEKSKE